jgi:hypothetical protein
MLMPHAALALPPKAEGRAEGKYLFPIKEDSHGVSMWQVVKIKRSILKRRGRSPSKQLLHPSRDAQVVLIKSYQEQYQQHPLFPT